MKTFEIHYNGHVTIQAESLREAKEIMQKYFPDYDPVDFYDCDNAKSNEVIGYCEISGLAIFDGDSCNTYADGVMCLKEFEK